MNPPKSTREHKEKGNYRPSRHGSRAEGKLRVLQTIPDPPEHFAERERNLWERACKDVFEMGILANPDIQLLEMYVTHWFLWQDSVKDINENGLTKEFAVGEKVTVIRNPSIQVMNESSKIVNQISDKFGFSPRARMGIKTQETKPEDPFAKFLEN